MVLSARVEPAWHLLSKSAQRINTECLSDFGSAQFARFASAALRCALVVSKIETSHLRLYVASQLRCIWRQKTTVLIHCMGGLVCVKIYWQYCVGLSS